MRTLCFRLLQIESTLDKGPHRDRMPVQADKQLFTKSNIHFNKMNNVTQSIRISKNDRILLSDGSIVMFVVFWWFLRRNSSPDMSSNLSLYCSAIFFRCGSKIKKEILSPGYVVCVYVDLLSWYEVGGLELRLHCSQIVFFDLKLNPIAWKNRPCRIWLWCPPVRFISLV